jgi:hypothetical protein
MAMNRIQLRAMKEAARHKAQRLKPPVRTRIKRWLQPIRSALAEMKTGEVSAVKGYPVTRLHTGDDYARIDHAINGFVALINRVLPDIDTTALTSISKKLEVGVLLKPEELFECSTLVDYIEDGLMTLKLGDLVDAATTEQIKISFELMGITE